MYGRRILSLPDVRASSQDSINQAVSSEDLPRRRRYLGSLLEHFWKRWSREYVTELRNLHRQRSRPESRMAVSVGDVVTVFEDNLPRSRSRLGRVEQLIPGADDCVRAAVIKVITKSGRPMTVKRPVQKLFPPGGRDQWWAITRWSKEAQTSGCCQCGLYSETSWRVTTGKGASVSRIIFVCSVTHVSGGIILLALWHF